MRTGVVQLKDNSPVLLNIFFMTAETTTMTEVFPLNRPGRPEMAEKKFIHK